MQGKPIDAELNEESNGISFNTNKVRSTTLICLQMQILADFWIEAPKKSQKSCVRRHLIKKYQIITLLKNHFFMCFDCYMLCLVSMYYCINKRMSRPHEHKSVAKVENKALLRRTPISCALFTSAVWSICGIFGRFTVFMTQHYTG